MLLNYLVNAIKFTDSGSVWLDLRAEPVHADRAKLTISVTDTGCGIPAEAQKTLFQPFIQVDSSSTRKHSGTGLGFALSKRLAELMGGEVGLSSRVGQGSTFWLRVTLPYAV